MFCRKGVLENFTKLTGKHLCWSLCFNKVANLRPESLLKKRTPTQVFSLEFNEFFLRILSYRKPPFGCFCTKGLFLPIFCKEKSFKQITFQHTGLTSSSIKFYMTRFLLKSYSLIWIFNRYLPQLIYSRRTYLVSA